MSVPVFVWSLFASGLCFGVAVEAVMRPARRRPLQQDAASLHGVVRGENVLIGGILLIIITDSLSWVTMGSLLGISGLAALTRAERLKNAAARPSWMPATWFIVIGVWLMILGTSSPLISAGDDSWSFVVAGIAVILGLSMVFGTIAGYALYRLEHSTKKKNTCTDPKECVTAPEAGNVGS
jgi:membrane protein